MVVVSGWDSNPSISPAQGSELFAVLIPASSSSRLLGFESLQCLGLIIGIAVSKPIKAYLIGFDSAMPMISLSERL